MTHDFNRRTDATARQLRTSGIEQRPEGQNQSKTQQARPRQNNQTKQEKID